MTSVTSQTVTIITVTTVNISRFIRTLLVTHHKAMLMMAGMDSSNDSHMKITKWPLYSIAWWFVTKQQSHWLQCGVIKWRLLDYMKDIKYCFTVVILKLVIVCNVCLTSLERLRLTDSTYLRRYIIFFWVCRIKLVFEN